MKSGLVVMDKPGGMTSHEIVTRVRRIMGSRKVGHAGTLATIRLGSSTTTDDADGAIGSLFHWIPALAVDLDDVAFKHDNVVYGVRELPVTW